MSLLQRKRGRTAPRCWRPPDMHKPQRGQARAVNVALPRHSFAFCLVLKSQGSRPRGPFHFTRTAPRIASSPYAPAGNKFLPFTSGASEENHRWTQMNTDSEGETPRVLLLALGRCPANEFTPWKSAVLSSSYLCLSVSICGCIELFRLRQAEPGNLRRSSPTFPPTPPRKRARKPSKWCSSKDRRRNSPPRGRARPTDFFLLPSCCLSPSPAQAKGLTIPLSHLRAVNRGTSEHCPRRAGWKPARRSFGRDGGGSVRMRTANSLGTVWD